MAPEAKIASMWKAFVPTVQWLPEYHLGWLQQDLVAGITCNMRVRGEWQKQDGTAITWGSAARCGT